MRELAIGQEDVKLVSPRPTVRAKLNHCVEAGYAKRDQLRPRLGHRRRTKIVELEGGRTGRRYLDCGENPPNGAIIYYWLPDDAEGPIMLTFRDAADKPIVAFSSDDKDAPFHTKPGTKGRAPPLRLEPQVSGTGQARAVAVDPEQITKPRRLMDTTGGRRERALLPPEYSPLHFTA
ncbi:hypothetical protein [Mesorhizobium sp. M0187]|uniref:hypothetical protein n=1 Tax=Mesorhizobium sp. M0187 TaxID=2956908 RepID=UPI003337A76E